MTRSRVTAGIILTFIVAFAAPLRADSPDPVAKAVAALYENIREETLENKAILPLLFGAKTPYGHPVIGEKAHVRAATAEVIKAYYDRWYHPNNACLLIVGGFDPDQVLARVKELFGPIPKGKLPERKT